MVRMGLTVKAVCRACHGFDKAQPLCHLGGPAELSGGNDIVEGLSHARSIMLLEIILC